MRAFIGIDLPKEIKDKLYTLQKEIGNNYAKINWVHKKNLHLTLKFFVDISETDVKRVISMMKDFKFNPFKARLGELGFFPNINNPRVLWVGLEPLSELMNFQGDIDEKLSCSFNREAKFNAHLTLGRIKLIKDKEKFLRLLKNIKIPNSVFEISEISFVKSMLTRDGPKYKLLEKF